MDRIRSIWSHILEFPDIPEVVVVAQGNSIFFEEFARASEDNRM